MLIIKYKMLKFPEQGRGRWLYFDLRGENADEPTLQEEQHSLWQEQRELPGWRDGQQHTVGAEHRPHCSTAVLSLLASPRDHNNLRGCG